MTELRQGRTSSSVAETDTPAAKDIAQLESLLWLLEVMDLRRVYGLLFVSKIPFASCMCLSFDGILVGTMN